MGLIRKFASIMMLSGVSSHTRHEPPGKAERARAKAERAREEAAQAQAVRAEAEAKVAEEQAAARAGVVPRGGPGRLGRHRPDAAVMGRGARVAVDGLEYVSAVGPCVVVSNHRSGRSHYP
jgi:hypothetical protein